MTPRRRIVISCPKGLSSYLAGEVLSLGFEVKSETAVGVTTEGSFDDTLRLNLHLRTGHRVLYHLDDFTAVDPGELYKKMYGIRWEDYIFEDGYVCVSSSVEHESIRDSRFANVKCKDAIVDRLRATMGRRPDSGPSKEGAVVFFHWKGNRCSVYLDTSGESLSRRGYRKTPLKAPLQETLAAALIMATGWRGENHFINPMCGSGTLAIEAALSGTNQAAGLTRDNFSFMHVKGFNEALWRRLRADARDSAITRMPGKVVATDKNPEAVEAAKRNAENAGVAHLIEFGTCDFAETVVPDGGGVVVLNPEYGERMGQVDDLVGLYRRIGDFFKQRCRGYTGYVFTGNPSLAKEVGLRPKRRMQFFNSTIECRLLEYELYEGSKKKGRSGGNEGG